jgi:hypothetical protein
VNSTIGLHVACQAATAKVAYCSFLPLSAADAMIFRDRGGIRRPILVEIAGGLDGKCRKRNCRLFTQVKQMQIARFLCTRWGKYIRILCGLHGLSNLIPWRYSLARDD